MDRIQLNVRPPTSSRPLTKMDPHIHEATGDVLKVDVFGGSRARAMFRSFRPDRIERIARHRGVAREVR